LNDDRKAVNGCRALVLGVAYKPNIDDVRESPALDVIRLLEAQGAEVKFHDPYIDVVRDEGHEIHGVPLTDAELDHADVVVIVTDHSSVDYQRVVNRASLVVDTRNATVHTRPAKARVVSLAAVRGPDVPAASVS
jgi:UDP-N-acetyl-D-glucosamine dehydrogenase